VNHVKSGFFFASKRSEIFASISNFASEAKVRAHPNVDYVKFWKISAERLLKLFFFLRLPYVQPPVSPTMPIAMHPSPLPCHLSLLLQYMSIATHLPYLDTHLPYLANSHPSPFRCHPSLLLSQEPHISFT
jgi:hypothetical protein